MPLLLLCLVYPRMFPYPLTPPFISFSIRCFLSRFFRSFARALSFSLSISPFLFRALFCSLFLSLHSGMRLNAQEHSEALIPRMLSGGPSLSFLSWCGEEADSEPVDGQNTGAERTCCDHAGLLHTPNMELREEDMCMDMLTRLFF